MQPEQLLAKALSGHESAFVAILDLFEQPVFAYLRWRGVERADAEDLTQQVFLTLLEHGRRFDPRSGRLRGFVFGIARRVWLKHMADRGRRVAALPQEVIDERVDSPQQQAIRSERRALAVRAMERLPDATREVLALRIYHSLPLKEIADAMELPLNTVKSHLFRARLQLRSRIAGELDSNEGP